MAVGEDAIWVPDVGRGMIYKIDSQTHLVVKELQSDLIRREDADTIGVGDGAVWVITGAGGNRLRRYSAKSGIEETTIPLPSSSLGVIVAFGSVWISGTRNDELYRVDPTTNQIAATVDTHAGPHFLAAGEGSVWVANEGDGTVQRFDGKSGGLMATIETGSSGRGAIAVGGGFVWVSTRLGALIQIDPHTNSVRNKFKNEAHEYFAMRYGGGSLWESGSSVRRIKTPE